MTAKRTYEVVGSFLVTADGRYRKGTRVELTDAEAEHALKFGGIKPVGGEPAAEPTEPVDGDAVDGDESGDEQVRPPAQSEPKSAFVDYAVDHLGLDRDGAEAMSKAELVELTRQ